MKKANKTKKPAIKVRDLKPKKDARGGAVVKIKYDLSGKHLEL